jgi:hypothetical protein
MNTQLVQKIANEIQMFQTIDQKQDFLFLLGALMTRVISLKKVSEEMNIEPDVLLKILDLMGIDFSYLTEEDIQTEKNW